MHFKHAEQKCHCRKRLLTAWEKVNILNWLSRWLNTNFNRWFKAIVRLFQNKLALTAAEEISKANLKFLINLIKLSKEFLAHWSGQILNYLHKLALRFFDVAYLLLKEGVAFADLFIFLNSTDVDWAEALNCNLNLVESALSRRHIINLNIKRLCLVLSELILLKEHIVKLIILFFHCNFSFIKTNNRTRKLFSVLIFNLFLASKLCCALFKFISLINLLAYILIGLLRLNPEVIGRRFNFIDWDKKRLIFLFNWLNLVLNRFNPVKLRIFSEIKFFNRKLSCLVILGKGYKFKIDFLALFPVLITFCIKFACIAWGLFKFTFGLWNFIFNRFDFNLAGFCLIFKLCNSLLSAVLFINKNRKLRG